MKKPFIIYLLLFFYINAYSQKKNNIDSLLQVYSVQKEGIAKVETMHLISRWELSNKPEVARKYAEEMITVSKKINYLPGLAKGYDNLGFYYGSKTSLDSAIIYATKAKSLITTHTPELLRNNLLHGDIYWRKKEYDSSFYYLIKNSNLYKNRDSSSTKQNEDFKKWMGGTYNMLGLIYMETGKYTLALKNELKALKLFKEFGETYYTAVICNNIGKIEFLLENYKQALIYYEESEKMFRLSGKNTMLLTTMMNRISILISLKETDKAIKLHIEAIRLAQKFDEKLTEAQLWTNIGVSYFDLKKDKESINSYLRALKLYKNLKIEEVVLYHNLGNYYTRKKNSDSAFYYYNKTIKVAEAQNNLSILSKVYVSRHDLYKEKGEYKKALEDYEVYTKLKDSLFNKEKSEQIEELRATYDTERKEQKIQNQKKEIDLLNIKEKVNGMQLLLLTFGLLIALIGIYAIYQRNIHHSLAREKAEIDLEYKNKELTTHALHLAKKNEILSDIKEKAEIFKADATYDAGYQTLIQTINFDIQDDNNWKNFSNYFEAVHKNFNTKAKQQFPNITSNDLRLMALIKMNLSSKEIANILNISGDGIKKARQRLRKKMELKPTDSLEAVIIAI
ncbi:tetratricopeptide repeat protein [Flavobacterium sp. W22_SRS_FK3]|uniref:tetratricopeptide repeat protein n=1 Tax=Flavobacterium sp. W22_SRS_FK3 TaxID=3240275 RepID=UPI003F8E0CD1